MPTGVHIGEAGDGSLVSQMKCGPKDYVFPWTTNGHGHQVPSSIITISALEVSDYILFGPVINHRE